MPCHIPVYGKVEILLESESDLLKNLQLLSNSFSYANNDLIVVVDRKSREAAICTQGCQDLRTSVISQRMARMMIN